jgi:hypothetical protein
VSLKIAGSSSRSAVSKFELIENTSGVLLQADSGTANASQVPVKCTPVQKSAPISTCLGAGTADTGVMAIMVLNADMIVKDFILETFCLGTFSVASGELNV